MCGITGIYNFNKDNIIDAEKLKLMNDKLITEVLMDLGIIFKTILD